MKKGMIVFYAVVMFFVFNIKAMAMPLPSVAMTKAEGVYINTTPDQAVWVTPTGNATLTASGDTVVIEQGGSATISGDHEKVYVKKGGTAIVAGTGNAVYYESGAQVTVTGAVSQSIQVDSFSA
jgi:hypothetical protein